MDAYELVKRLIADEAIDCEFRECGYLDLAWAPSHADDLARPVETLAALRGRSRRSSRGSGSARRSAATFYHGGLVFPPSGLLHPGKYFAGLVGRRRRAPARTSTRASGPGRSGARPTARLVVETDRGAILAKDVVVGTNGYTDGVVPALRRRIIPIGSYIIATEPLPEELAREPLAEGPGLLRHEELPLLLARVGGPPDDLRRPGELPADVGRPHRRAILHKGMLEVHPQLAGYRIEYAWGGNVGFTFDRMPHVGRMDGVTYAMGCCGTGVALMTCARDRGRRLARRRTGAGAAAADVPARPGAVRGPAVVPAVRRRVVPAPGPIDGRTKPAPESEATPRDDAADPGAGRPPALEIVGAEDRDGVLVRDIRRRRLDRGVPRRADRHRRPDVVARARLRPLVRHRRAERQPDRIRRRGGRLGRGPTADPRSCRS